MNIEKYAKVFINLDEPIETRQDQLPGETGRQESCVERRLDLYRRY